MVALMNSGYRLPTYAIYGVFWILFADSISAQRVRDENLRCNSDADIRAGLNEYPELGGRLMTVKHEPGQVTEMMTPDDQEYVVAVSKEPEGKGRTSRLESGKYTIQQSWSQEKNAKRPFFVSVPRSQRNQPKRPVFIFLHGNGGNAQGAMNGFKRHRKRIVSQYIMVFPQGYRESWNIVSERSKADDLRFIESIVLKLAKFDNVDSKNFTIMGASNGSAMVNQLAIESRLPNIRNYISGVSPLNVFQYDGGQFKAKGERNNYRVAMTPAKGKRLMNISGVRDRLVPYAGGESKVIPAKNGKLAFVAAEKSTFIWAKHFGYVGKQLTKPTRTGEEVDVFSYLNGDVIHCKVKNEGHGATHGISEDVLLEFLRADETSRKN